MRREFLYVVCWALMWLMILELPCSVCGDTETIGICAMPGCNCSFVVHRWINVKCIFSDDQDIELREGSIPADASEVSVSSCRELKIHSGAFTGGAQLKRVHVTGIHSVVAKRQAFHNISAPNPLLEVSECNRVILESHAFKNARGTLSVSISHCEYVEIKPNAFSWLLRFTVKEVSKLELSSNAFKFDAPPFGRHGPATKIMFQTVKILELPSSVFPSAVAEIRMDDVGTRVIRKDAFCAMTILSIKISNTSIFEIESGAFSDQTLIRNFELVDVRLKTIKTGAFRAGVTNFTIQYSRLIEIERGAIEVSAAAVTFNNNEFHNLRKRAIILKEWSRIVIDHNLFVDLEEDAIIADEIAKATPELPNLEFTFRGNRITKAAERSLKFAAVSEKANVAEVGNNYFKETCNCLMEDWIRKMTGKNTSVTWMMESSFCVASKWLGECFKIPQGYFGMRNFTKTFCTADGDVTCKEPSEKIEPSVSPPSVGPHVYPRQNSYFDVEMSDPEQLEREKWLIIIVCFAVIFAVIAIILTSGVLYMKRRGVCPKLTSGTLNFTNSWLSPTSGMTAATSARSISRLSINEYAGVSSDTRILDVENQTIDDDDDEINNEAYAYTENKATQTLPEELTEEYLKELRERLNDPDNYSQARDMIEHLYDLIKVEESCNNNNDRPTITNEENAYDVIAPRLRRSRIQKPSVNMGTRVPSLEKLLPCDRVVRPAIAEYTDPRDLQIMDQNHLYAELPGDETVPSTSRLSEPVLPIHLSRAPLPLPPDVVNDHYFTNRSDKRLSDEINEDNQYQEAVVKGQQRPLSFLKALGESILGTKTKKPTNALLCEYADPTDVAAHLYSELPELQGTSTPIIKMANRPLPVKPDQETVHVART